MAYARHMVISPTIGDLRQSRKNLSCNPPQTLTLAQIAAFLSARRDNPPQHKPEFFPILRG